MKNLLNLINHIEERIWSYDGDLICTCSNERAKIDFLNSFGVELVPGVSVLAGVPEPFCTQWKDLYVRGLNGEKFSFIYCFEIESLPAYLNVTFTPIVEEGEVVGVACISHDISELKFAQEKVQQNEAHLIAQIENSTGAIWSIDKNYNLLIFNKALGQGFRGLYGVDIHVGDNIVEVAPRKDGMQHIWKDWYDRALAGESFTELQKFNFTEEESYVELSFNPIRVNEEVVGVACFTKDITALKTSELALQKSVELKDRFFSIIAHDLKGPVGNIRELVKMISSSSMELSDEQEKEIISHLSNATNGVYELLDNLLAWALSQQNFVKAKKESLNVNTLIEGSIKAYRTSAESKAISTLIKVDKSVEVLADKRALSSTIANLYNNAIKFTDELGKITISVKQTSHDLEFCVSDTGVGMDDQSISSLFDESRILTKAGTRKERGTGLGLLLCKEFVTLNGGEIWVKSKVGTGTSFFFTIPLSNEA